MLAPQKGKAPTWGASSPGGSVNTQPWILAVTSLFSPCLQSALPLTLPPSVWDVCDVRAVGEEAEERKVCPLELRVPWGLEAVYQ